MKSPSIDTIVEKMKREYLKIVDSRCLERFLYQSIHNEIMDSMPIRTITIISFVVITVLIAFSVYMIGPKESRSITEECRSDTGISCIGKPLLGQDIRQDIQNDLGYDIGLNVENITVKLLHAGFSKYELYLCRFQKECSDKAIMFNSGEKMTLILKPIGTYSAVQIHFLINYTNPNSGLVESKIVEVMKMPPQ
jgi:hypothetical protein